MASADASRPTVLVEVQKASELYTDDLCLQNAKPVCEVKIGTNV